MKIHVPSMLPIGVETINKQIQQTNKQPQWLIKITISHHGLENKQPQCICLVGEECPVQYSTLEYSTILYALQYICICVGCIVKHIFNCTPGFHIEEKGSVLIICPLPSSLLHPACCCLMEFIILYILYL